MIILIPAYQPDGSLVDLVRSLRSAAPDLVIVVVDDGSGPRYRPLFSDVVTLGGVLIGSQINQGKGAALKAGFGFIEEQLPGHDVVCADADGQHSVLDILRVAEHVGHRRDAMVLGMRTFAGSVPARSRLGNSATRLLFRLSTGRRLRDTQTGLRGYPSTMLGWLRTVKGDRYEYELNLLLEACAAGIPIESIDIATIYLHDNSSSHFRPLADSVRIYRHLLAFLLSSMTAFVVDLVALLVLGAIVDSLLVAVLGARVISSGVNFLVNRRVVFEHGRDRPVGRAAIGYFALVVTLLSANYLLLLGLTAVQFPLLAAKLVVEVCLFAVSYAIQSRFVFARGGAALSATEAGVSARPAALP